VVFNTSFEGFAHFCSRVTRCATAAATRLVDLSLGFGQGNVQLGRRSRRGSEGRGWRRRHGFGEVKGKLRAAGGSNWGVGEWEGG